MDDINVRWGLAIVASLGVLLNAIMLARLNRDMHEARDYGLLDAERSIALRARRWQSAALMVIALLMALSAVFEAGSGIARFLVFGAALLVDWKSWRLFGDRLNADVMLAERLKRDAEERK